MNGFTGHDAQHGVQHTQHGQRSQHGQHTQHGQHGFQNTANGFAQHGLDEKAFAGGSTAGLKAFDAFPKTKATYTRRSTTGGYWTIALSFLAAFLALAELRTFLIAPAETQSFSVETGDGQSAFLQINLDTVVAMPCDDLHINVQDAAGDRILAGELLKREPTAWLHWVDAQGRGPLRGIDGRKGGAGTGQKGDAAWELRQRAREEERDTHVRHVLGEVRRGARRFPATPALSRGQPADACRIFGSIEGNRVQGDFHITARGHGYIDWGGSHVAHDSFNFSHVITELSFGPHYPSLLNPLDHTLATTPQPFNRFQYYLSIVPTIYTRARDVAASLAAPPPASGAFDTTTNSPGLETRVHRVDRHTVHTNQYAVTSSSRPVPESNVPGIFFKFDIEAVRLTVRQARPGAGWVRLLARMVNVVSGVLVGGGWLYALIAGIQDFIRGRAGRRRFSQGDGMLHGRKEEEDEGVDDG